MRSMNLRLPACELGLERRRRGRAAKGQTSAGQRLGEKRQALVHPVIDTGVVVGELLIAMRNAKLVEPPHEPTDTVQQIELILLAAVDVSALSIRRLPAWVSIATTGSCRNQFAQRSSITSHVSNVTGTRMPRNCVGSGS